MNFAGLYEVRDYKPSDESFVLSTFLRGLYHGDSWFSKIPKDIFMDNYHIIAERLVRSPNVTIKIACLPDDPDVILGYSILSADYSAMHWVYVKKIWRGKGIGRSLTPTRLEAVTHLSSLGESLLKAKLKDTVFNPFKI